LKRCYIDGPNGQVHVQEWGSENPGAPLICLAPAPFTSAAYLTLAPLLASQRRVIAVDYPGYGNSDPVSEQPSIADFADAIAAVARGVSDGQAVDLFGFHTGCLVAVETSLRHPDSVNHLLLNDVPFFDSQRQHKLTESMRKKSPIGTELSVLQTGWDFCIAKKVEHIPLTRAYENFIDYIREGDKASAAFYAAFNYPCHTSFAEVTHSTWVIATKAGLYDESCLAADAIKAATLIEVPEVAVSVLDKGAPIIADTVLQFRE